MFNFNIILDFYIKFWKKKKVKIVVDLKVEELISVDFIFIFCSLNFCFVLRFFVCIYILKFFFNFFEKNINFSL